MACEELDEGLTRKEGKEPERAFKLYAREMMKEEKKVCRVGGKLSLLMDTQLRKTARYHVFRKLQLEVKKDGSKQC